MFSKILINMCALAVVCSIYVICNIFAVKYTKLYAINPILINPFTTKDAIWRPRGIIHLRYYLMAHCNFYYTFQKPVH